MLKLLMFTDSKDTKTCILKEQNVNHEDIHEGIYHIDLAKPWVTEKRDKNVMFKPFKSGIAPVVIVFYSSIEAEIIQRAINPKMSSKLKPKLNAPSDMEMRLQALLDNVDL